MPTAQARPRAVTPWRNGALRPYPASASTQPKRTPAAMRRSTSASAISGFVLGPRWSAGTPARSNRCGSFVQLSGRNKRNATMTGTSPRASVNDTSVWQLAVLPSAEAYCGATPTIVARRQPRRHRLDAFAIAGADQPEQIHRQHPSPRLVTQLCQERRQPDTQFLFPISARFIAPFARVMVWRGLPAF